MFDELDDPAPSGPRPGAREMVAMRAARIQRTRRTGYVASAASLVLIAAAVSAGLRGGTEGLSHFDPVSSLSPSESAWPSETADPTTPPSPTASPSPEDAPGPASPSPSAEPSYIEWADGCMPIDGLPARGTAPHADLSVELAIADVVDADKNTSARIVVTNASDTDTYSFHIQPLAGADIMTAALDDEGHRSSYHYSDYISGGHVTVGPGDTDEVEVTVGVKTCGDDGEYDGVLPAGEYRMAVGFRWEYLTVTRGGQVSVAEPSSDVSRGPALPPLTQSPSPSPRETTPPPSPSEPPSPSPIPGSGVWGTAPVIVTVT